MVAALDGDPRGVLDTYRRADDGRGLDGFGVEVVVR